MSENNLEKKEVKKLSGSLFKINDKVLASYPVDVISVEEITPPKEYKVLDVLYVKPLGDATAVKITVVVSDIDGNILNATKEIRFKNSENQKVAESISPLSFWLLPEVKKDSPPEKLIPSHFVSKYPEVMVLSVDYAKPEITSKETVVHLTVRMTGLNSVMQVIVPIEFDLTQEQKVLTTIGKDDFKIETDKNADYELIIKDLKYVGIYDIEVIQYKIETMPSEERAVVEIEIKFGTKIKWIDFSIKHQIPKVIIEMKRLMNMSTVKPGFLKGCSPVDPKADFIVHPKQLSIISLKFVPPKTVDSLISFVVILFGYKGEVGKHLIKFKFDKSVKDFASAFQKKLNGDDFVYKKEKEIVAPPKRIVPDDFEADYDGIVIKDIVYDFEAIKTDETDIEIMIIADFRGIRLSYKKKMSFKMTYIEFLTASRLTDVINLELITLPKELHNPEFAKELMEDDKLMTKIILDGFFVGGQYLFEVVGVSVSKFNVHEKEVEYILSLEETTDGQTIERDIEYPIRFGVTYAEQTLMNVTDKDIKVNKDLMSSYPPDELEDQLFSCDHLYTILGVEYIIPEMTAREADISLKIGAGEKSIYLTKKLEFKRSKEEHQIRLWEQEDRDYINHFD
ncbi:MAG: hypothetical protein KAG04_00640, partial [Mycoplasmataceae bacterium]|nr:hypothetical protein [Mycoplasmataceae bacterium]